MGGIVLPGVEPGSAGPKPTMITITPQDLIVKIEIKLYLYIRKEVKYG